MKIGSLNRLLFFACCLGMDDRLLFSPAASSYAKISDLSDRSEDGDN